MPVDAAGAEGDAGPMPGGFEPDDALWAALAECEDRSQMETVLQAWIDANRDYWSHAEPSPAGWTAPAGSVPGHDWRPPTGLRPRLDRVPLWARSARHLPYLRRRVCSWMWEHGGYDVLPPGA